MNLKQLSHDIYHAARGDKCRVEDIEKMLENAMKLAETKGYTDAELDHGLALDSLEDKTVKRKFCLNCEYEIGASSVICTHCGTPVPSDAEAWQHANDTVVVGDLMRLGKENEALRAQRQRLFDLVRYQRAELHQAGLLSDDEYAEICESGATGTDAGSVARLETYDELRREVEAWRLTCKGKEGAYIAMEKENEALRQKVEELREWKKKQILVAAETRYHEIAKLINVPLGESIAPHILPAIKSLQQRLAAAEADKERLEAALQLIWRLALRKEVHLGPERPSGITKGCIPCICYCALRGETTAEDLREAIHDMKQ